jgi:hypothetical protein
MSSARAWATASFESNAKIFVNGKTVRKARSCARPCAPQPQIVTTDESGRARYFAATAEAAAVRLIVISIESSTASGRPLSPSQSRISPWMVGSTPSFLLRAKFVLSLATI